MFSLNIDVTFEVNIPNSNGPLAAGSDSEGTSVSKYCWWTARKDPSQISAWLFQQYTYLQKDRPQLQKYDVVFTTEWERQR